MKLVKGYLGATQTHFEPTYDADSDTYWFEVAYEGTEEAIFGIESGFRDEGISYHISNVGPLFTLQARVPQDEPVDRYEINTEATEKSIFEFPDSVIAARAYDASIADTDPTWRALAEEAIRKKNTSFGNVEGTIENLVVDHLRDGVTGWQVDFIALRRTRRVKRIFAFAAGGQFNLDVGLSIYSTAQLNVPDDVAFNLPVAFPTVDPTNYLWGWRRRSQRVEIVGQWFEQQIELLFAPWSLLFYDPASGDLTW